MKRLVPFACFIILGFTATAVSAATYAIPPLPDWPESSWDVGKSATYHVIVNQGEDELEFDLRMAIVGAEPEGDIMLSWLELDITNLTGIPRDMQDELLSFYGELPNAMRIKMLIPYSDLTRIWTDPSGFYFDLSDVDFIRALIFQYNRQVAYDFEPSLIGGLLLPLTISWLMPEELPEDFPTSRNLGIHLVEDPESFITELCDSEITVDAGTFDCSLFTFTSKSGEGDAGSIFYSDAIPIMPIISGELTNVGGAGPSATAVELVAIEDSGAQSQILGEPVWMDFTTMMGYVG